MKHIKKFSFIDFNKTIEELYRNSGKKKIKKNGHNIFQSTISEEQATSQAIGEEGGNSIFPQPKINEPDNITFALGESGTHDNTTMALGENGENSIFPQPQINEPDSSTLALGEDGKNSPRINHDNTTFALGEDGTQDNITFALGEDGTNNPRAKHDNTTLALGEDGENSIFS